MRGIAARRPFAINGPDRQAGAHVVEQRKIFVDRVARSGVDEEAVSRCRRGEARREEEELLFHVVEQRTVDVNS